MYSFSLRDQHLHTYKMAGKIIVFYILKQERSQQVGTKVTLYRRGDPNATCASYLYTVIFIGYTRTRGWLQPPCQKIFLKKGGS
jgi:hypothetical protein